MAWLRHKKGIQAEKAACAYLQEKGLHLIKKNFRCIYGEIDLIMRDENDIVFVEVRSRNRVDFGSAFDSVDQHKVYKLIKAATYFLQTKKWLDQVPSRFDVVAIHPVSGNIQIEWMKHAFTADGLTHMAF